MKLIPQEMAAIAAEALAKKQAEYIAKRDDPNSSPPNSEYYGAVATGLGIGVCTVLELAL